MAASEAAVNAVMRAIGCERDYSDFELSNQVEWCNEHREPNGDLVEWTDRGCPVAVAAADAAVDADRASIQAETLRPRPHNRWPRGSHLPRAENGHRAPETGADGLDIHPDPRRR
jgi:hypothetical protein